MIQVESMEEIYATFLKTSRVDGKNLSWFVKYLKTYKLIYRRYVKSLRSLMLKMQRAPMLTETTAASENNIYKSILGTVNAAEEHTRIIETDFSLIRDAVGAYLKKLAQLKKAYRVILAIQKQKKNDNNSERRALDQEEINKHKGNWRHDVYEAFKVRAKIYTKIKTIKLDFDFNRCIAPDSKAEKHSPDHSVVEGQRVSGRGPNCDSSLIFPEAAADSSGAPPSFCTAAYFEPSYSVATKHSP